MFHTPKDMPLMRKMVLLALLLLGPLPALAATLYISDELRVPLRGGPSTRHRILHAGLPSGTALEVLGEDKAAGFTQVRTPDGSEGWVATQYLTSQPIAKQRLAAATRRVQALETELKSLRERYQEVRGARSEVEGRAGTLSKQVEDLQARLEEVRRASATSLANYEQNKQLKADNQSLRTQVTQLAAQVRQLERNAMLRWLLSGGGLVLIGLLLGAWIKSRPRRGSWA